MRGYSINSNRFVMMTGPMIKEILIITADRTVFERIKTACGPLCENDTALFWAGDIPAAVERLQTRPVTLVLLGTLPRQKYAPELLFYIWKCYPDITVLNMAGERESPEEMIIEDGGIAVQPVRMPPDASWPEIIGNARQMERNGGFLRISDTSLFVQMIQQEQRTCTLRIYNNVTDQFGVLFFQKGTLENARLKTVQGKPAACAILSWDAVAIDVQDTCRPAPPRITHNLQALIIEGRINRDHSASYDTTAEWTDAAGEETQYCRKLMARIQEGHGSAPQKETGARPPDRPVLWTNRWFRPGLTVALVFLLGAAAFLAHRRLPDRGSEHITSGGKRIAILPHDPARIPPLTADSGKSGGTGRRSSVAGHPPDKMKKRSVPSTRSPLAQTAANVVSAAAVRRDLIRPRTVFIQYTHAGNRKLVHNLAGYLAARGFTIRGIEQIAYRRNEIRYFHPADKKAARMLGRETAGYLTRRHASKGPPPVYLKNLAATYPRVPAGQLEIWLRLPARQPPPGNTGERS